MKINGLNGTTEWRPSIQKPIHLETITPSGYPLSPRIGARIRTHVLRDLTGLRVQVVPLYPTLHITPYMTMMPPRVKYVGYWSAVYQELRKIGRKNERQMKKR